jgi:hypothetical protein
LSLYETDTRVIVRGKAGASVEFGNTLLLAEQPDGVETAVEKCTGWRSKSAPPAGSKMVS